MRIAAAALVAGFVALLLNSAYLGAAATPSLFYAVNVLLHVVLGASLAAIGAWRLRGARADAALAVAAPLLAVAAIAGFYLSVAGAAGANRGLLPVHIGTAVSGSAALLIWMIRRARASGNPVTRAAALVTAIVFLAAGSWAFVDARRYDGGRRAAYRIVNPEDAPARMEDEGAGASSPFFPSSANTNVNGTIPARFFQTSEMCGRCHRDIYEQWQSSAHHFSSFNNQWYRKSIEYMQDVVGTKPSKWCAGCHDHAVFFNGRFDRPIRDQIDTPEAQAGLGCTSCHAITRVNSTMGQGDFVVEYPALHDLAMSENPWIRLAHDQFTYVDPQPHRDTFLKPFHREQTAEFCSSCHKVHLDAPVNGYRWFRGFNDYDNWQASGVSGQGARSFYYPLSPQRCTDCHMPRVRSDDPAAKDGYVKSHRFPGANTALPFVNHDRAQLDAVQAFLRDGQISVDVFGIVRGGAPAGGDSRRERPAESVLSSTFAVGEESINFGPAETSLRAADEVIAPLDRVDAPVRRGESVRVEVVVRTRKVGHFFPGGTVDAFDVWVEFEAVDDRGRVLLHSGSVADGGKGPVDPGAHFFRSLLLDEHGNPINKRNAWAARSVAYVRLIPPGAADTVHYRLEVPKDAGDRIYLRAKVNYRKFAWWNTQWSYAGVRDRSQPPFSVAHGYDDGRWVFTGDTSHVSGGVKAIPDIPTTTMAAGAATLRVVDERAASDAPPVADKSVRERWNDYGIGLLLQGHLKGAEAIFERVTQMDPEYADGWVNVARARLQEGNLAGAEAMLRAALKIDGRLAKTHFFLGTVLKNDGRYDEALEHLQIAASQYPRDRVVRNQLGRVLFLQRRFEEAIVEFKRALDVDPEDLQAHYSLMLCYQGTARADLAERERVLYERFKADEASQAITGPYRTLHPEDNNERQAIHEHRSAASGVEAARR